MTIGIISPFRPNRSSTAVIVASNPNSLPEYLNLNAPKPFPHISTIGKSSIAEWEPISPAIVCGTCDRSSIHYLYRDAALAESAIKKLEKRTVSSKRRTLFCRKIGKMLSANWLGN
jgi:hypothetical protein